MKGYKRITAAMVLLALCSGVLPGTGTMVATATTTQEKIDQTEEEKNELENQLNQTHNQLEGLKGVQSSLRSELSGLNAQLTKVSENLADLEDKIEDKEEEIQRTLQALDEARETERWQQECMVIRVRDMYEQKDVSYLNALLGAESFSEMVNMADYFEKIAAYDQEKLQEFQETRQLIEEHEARLEADMKELEALKTAAEAERNKVSGLISKTSNSIADYADQISDAEQKAKDYEESIRKKEEDLAYLKKKLQEEMAMSQAAANAQWRDISEVSFAEGDLSLLANLIYCEAGGEPYEGKLAVGSVVINRVLSSVYPDTVVGVIYQNKQFSPVGSGRLDLALASDRANSDCYRAAEEAMTGMTNVGNCVYFRTPIEGLSGINIGGHVFY